MEPHENEEQCEHCRRKGGLYDFVLTCCRVRFVLTQPTRAQRADWLARWRERDGDAMADEIEKKVKEAWAAR